MRYKPWSLSRVARVLANALIGTAVPFVLFPYLIFAFGGTGVLVTGGVIVLFKVLRWEARLFFVKRRARRLPEVPATVTLAAGEIDWGGIHPTLVASNQYGLSAEQTRGGEVIIFCGSVFDDVSPSGVRALLTRAQYAIAHRQSQSVRNANVLYTTVWVLLVAGAWAAFGSSETVSLLVAAYAASLLGVFAALREQETLASDHLSETEPDGWDEVRKQCTESAMGYAVTVPSWFGDYYSKTLVPFPPAPADSLRHGMIATSGQTLWLMLKGSLNRSSKNPRSPRSQRAE